MIYRIYIEKRDKERTSIKLKNEIKSITGVEAYSIRKILRYDIEGIDKQTCVKAYPIFCEAPVDEISEELKIDKNDKIIVSEYLDGQFDQRADSAMQCVQLLTGGVRPIIKCATIYIFSGIEDKIELVQQYLINPVESKLGNMQMPETLKNKVNVLGKMRVEIDGFIQLNDAELEKYYSDNGFAMSQEDLKYVRDYFKSQHRQPTETELKVIDTYWSDHCRHTTFSTKINSIKIISDNNDIIKAKNEYIELFNKLYENRSDKYHCLMDIATIAAKKLKNEGYLNNLDLSDEINACSVTVEVDVNDKIEQWLIMFKNETHNHPTEIEPFGGAATCLGGAIRDPLSGRCYVYQAMRITGAANPLVDVKETLKGKLPQRVLTKNALSGFSAYGNQIGLATGIVREIYNDKYVAKRLECGYVIGAVKKENVVRDKPQCSDVVILLGGDTGRDGCGGATGSSKSHTEKSVETCGAEVQKGNAPEERKLQRLFRNPNASKLILKCNDFGAGGVSVAIGELSDGVDIYLDKINKKYDGLNATELAISESQERMAVVVKKERASEFIKLAETENLKATIVATVTDKSRLYMTYGDEVVCDIQRAFLDTNGVRQQADAEIIENKSDFFEIIDNETNKAIEECNFEKALKNELKKLNVCSQKGLGEVFDSTIGAASVLMPFGGKKQLTPSEIMACKPAVNGVTHTVTCSSYGIYTDLLDKTAFTGAIYSIVGAVSKLVASGVELSTIRLSLQEFFKKLNKDEQRWGEVVAAMLGALKAQLGLKLAAIGGKDSMSGSYENYNVPSTVIAFAMGITKDDTLVNNAFNQDGYVYRFKINKNENGTPNFDCLVDMYQKVHEYIKSKEVLNCCVSGEGGCLVSVIKCLMGNGKGFIKSDVEKEDFKASYGDILLVTKNRIEGKKIYGEVKGFGQVIINGQKINLENLEEAFCSTLSEVFPVTVNLRTNKIWKEKEVEIIKKKSSLSIAQPRVFIPVFPGTNCEYDTAKAFEKVGAKADIFVIKNLSGKDIEYSITEMAKRIKQSQIIAFPGGFSGGDEPDGSGKFIATTFRNPILNEAVMDLLYNRDGLALGICNGFQALIKLGLLPWGEIKDMNELSPTLTFNDIMRHVSTICKIKVTNASSPWLNMCNGKTYSVPVSHGEGRLMCDNIIMDKLVDNNIIATQYVDNNGIPTMEYPFNPNGSLNAVEGLISKDGRVFGKMGHAERYEKGLYQNIEGEFEMPIFLSAVKYYE
ncbi:MAG: phosphoribosylformylglycinamidine synthase [Clostridia bacterium]